MKIFQRIKFSNASVTGGAPVVGTGVAPRRKLAAARLKMDRTIDTLEKAGFSTLPMALPPKTRFARFRRGVYPGLTTTRN